MMKKIVVCEPLSEELSEELSHLASDYEITYLLVKKEDIQDVEIIYGWSKELPKLEEMTSLKWIQSFSAGVNYFDLETLKDMGVILTSASGIHGHQMTESILGMLFSHTRKIKESILNQEKHKWGVEGLGTDLLGKSVLIFGTGNIGTQLAKVLDALGADVYGVNRSGLEVDYFKGIYTYKEINHILPKADIVVNLLPETPETINYFDNELFDSMKTGVMFINAGRGSAVKTETIIKQCQDEKLSFAGLDVFEEEPLPSDSPLWDLEQVLITPHISGPTDQYNNRLFEVFKQNIESYLNGEDMINVVNLDLGY